LNTLTFVLAMQFSKSLKWSESGNCRIRTPSRLNSVSDLLAWSTDQCVSHLRCATLWHGVNRRESFE